MKSAKKLLAVFLIWRRKKVNAIRKEKEPKVYDVWLEVVCWGSGLSVSVLILFLASQII